MSARSWMLVSALAIGWASPAAGAITMDEALSLSQRTGRPVLAVAGSKT